MVHGRTTICQGMVSTSTLMEFAMTASIQMIKKKGSAFTIGQTVENMKGGGTKESNMGQVHILTMLNNQ